MKYILLTKVPPGYLIVVAIFCVASIVLGGWESFRFNDETVVQKPVDSSSSNHTVTIPKQGMNKIINITATKTRAHGPKGRQQSVCDALLSAGQSLKHVNYKQDSCLDIQIGNALPRIFMAYAMTQSAGASFSFTCAGHEKLHIPTIMSLLSDDPRLFSSIESTSVRSSLASNISLQDLCSKCDSHHPHECASMDFLVGIIRRYLRRITQSPKVNHANNIYDVVLHYRCGDVFKVHNDRYGLLPHSTYENLIRIHHSPSDRMNIAVVTQTLDPKQKFGRPVDLQYAEKCHIVTQDLMKYLKEKFPSANVSIPFSRSIAQDYFRLIQARSMAICGPSTFCLWPTLSNQNPQLYRSGLFPWVGNLDTETFNVYSSQRLRPKANQTLDEMEIESIVSWLRTKGQQ